MRKLSLKRALSLLVAVICVFSALSILSCAPSSEKSEELLAAFKEAYEKSVVINEYVWGEGLPVLEYDRDKEKIDFYVEVTEDAPYRTREDLTAAIKEVYCESYVKDAIIPMLFDGYGEGSSVAPRYSQTSGPLFMNVGFKDFDITGRFLPDTAVVKKATATTATFEVTYQMESGTKQYTLMMILEDGKWKFNGPTY